MVQALCMCVCVCLPVHACVLVWTSCECYGNCGTAYLHWQEEKENAQGSAKEEEREEEEGEEEGQEREGEELDSESKAALMKELVELKERKDRLCRLVAELEEYG